MTQAQAVVTGVVIALVVALTLFTVTHAQEIISTVAKPCPVHVCS